MQTKTFFLTVFDTQRRLQINIFICRISDVISVCSMIFPHIQSDFRLSSVYTQWLSCIVSLPTSFDQWKMVLSFVAVVAVAQSDLTDRPSSPRTPALVFTPERKAVDVPAESGVCAFWL